MLAEDGKEPVVGASVPSDARVFGWVLEQTRGPKLIIFKKKRRKNHRRTKGHRQDLTAVKIASISPTGDAAAATAAEPEPLAKSEPISEQEITVADAAPLVREPEPALQE